MILIVLNKRASTRQGSLFPIPINKAVTRKLGELIINAYLLPIIISTAQSGDVLPRKIKMQSFLDGGFG